MKKLIGFCVLSLSLQSASAQGDGVDSGELMRIIGSITVLVLFMVFILAILKRYLDHRLRNKIVDRGLSENLAASLLQSTPQDNQNANIKWSLLLGGLGAGLTVVHYTQPLGIHSLAIMAFSISFAFLGYYFFTRQK